MSRARGNIQVLHVDDEPDFLEMAAEFIEREDAAISVDTATSATEGLAAIDRTGYDCVVSDFDMPGTNGIEFLEAVREAHPDLPFILYTGKGSEEVASEAISAGVTNYLQKGGGAEQYALLDNRIRNSVAQHRAEQEIETTERRYRRLIEETSDVIVVAGPDGGFEYLSPAAEEVLGYPADELLGENGFEYIHPDDRESVMREFNAMVEDPDHRPAVEFRFEKPDGAWAWIEARGRNLLDDDVLGGLVVYARDVTERRDHQRELSRKGEIVRRMNDGAVIAQDGVIKDVNAAVAELVGYEPEALVGEPMAAFIAEEDRALVAERHRSRVDDDVPSPPERYEIGLRSADPGTVPVEISVSRIEFEGAPATLSLVRDITDRKAQEAERRQLKREFETVFETAQDGIFLFDVGSTDAGHEFRLRRLNPAHEAISGLSTERDRGKTPRELLGEEVGASVAENYGRCVEAREPITYEERLDMPSGTIHWQTKLSPVIRDGEVRQIVGVARDVSEQRARERQLEAVLEKTPSAIYIKDADGRYTLMNEPAAAQFGIEPEAAIGKRDEELFDAESAAEIAALDEQVMASGEPVSEEAVRSIDGERRVFDNHKYPFRGADGEVIGVLGISREITGLRTHERELERQIERLDEFASVVSHDLRNPLEVAAGRLELAAEECDSEHLEAVGRALDRMETLIERMLSLTRAGATVGETDRVDLADLVETSWALVETGAAELTIDARRTVEADPDRLKQLFENLFRNAVDHAGRSVRVRVEDLPDGFAVEDDGPGIPASEREAVFDPGYSTTDDGTGFGLSIVRDIAEAHGWDVAATDADGGGARFEFTGVRPADGGE